MLFNKVIMILIFFKYETLNSEYEQMSGLLVTGSISLLCVFNNRIIKRRGY